jgi:D-threo-aldose 1-dehydrogenase
VQSIDLAPNVRSTRLGFGCAGLMRDSSSEGRQRVLAAAFDEGIRHFDLARMYGLGTAESEFGKFARGRRAELVVATKFGIEPASASGRVARFQAPARRLMARYPALRRLARRHSGALHRPHKYDAATARASLETSLRELRMDYVDILFLHDPSPDDAPVLSEVCAYLEEARQAGYIRAWGVAGECDPCIQIKRVLPSTAILQVRDDLFRASSLAEDLKPCVTFGVLSGAIGRILAHISGSPGTRDRWSNAIGADCGLPETIASLLLREAIATNPDSVVLLSTTRAERLRGVDLLLSPSDRERGDEALNIFKRLVGDELISA